MCPTNYFVTGMQVSFSHTLPRIGYPHDLAGICYARTRCSKFDSTLGIFTDHSWIEAWTYTNNHNNDFYYDPCSWKNEYFSNTRAVCGVKTLFSNPFPDALIDSDKGGIHAMKARFCDVYYIFSKTMNPASLK